MKYFLAITFTFVLFASNLFAQEISEPAIQDYLHTVESAMLSKDLPKLLGTISEDFQFERIRRTGGLYKKETYNKGEYALIMEGVFAERPPFKEYEFEETQVEINDDKKSATIKATNALTASIRYSIPQGGSQPPSS